MSRATGKTTKAEMPWHWWTLRYGTAFLGLFFAMCYGVIGNTALGISVAASLVSETPPGSRGEVVGERDRQFADR